MGKVLVHIEREKRFAMRTPARRMTFTVSFAAFAGVGLSVLRGTFTSATTTVELVGDPKRWTDYLPVSVIVFVAVLLGFSAFFSACETAFLSIPKPRLRSLREEDDRTSRWVVQLLDNPGRLLTTILVANLFVNTLIGVALGSRITELFEIHIGLSPALAYLVAILLSAGVLLLFGEILPKVCAVRARETYARFAVVPLMMTDWFLQPVRQGLLRCTDAIFRITRFHELRAAPYITDEELKSVLADEQTKGVIEEDGRQMIRGILESGDVQVSEILTPRPDIVALSESATAAEAVELFRQHEYTRVPVYRDDMDHITGIVFAKDLLAGVVKGSQDRLVKTLAHPPHFVPATMTVHGFIKDVQRHRSHLAIVVDEYGGTKGIVTLHAAIEQVVGDIKDEYDEEGHMYECRGEGEYYVDGGMPIDELSALIGRPIVDDEHNTIAGFLMGQTEKVLAVGDTITYAGIVFSVEQVDRKRASKVRVSCPPLEDEEVAS